MPQPATIAASRFRALMRAGCVSTPGAFNGLIGRTVAQSGFDACYVSGAAVSAARGLPDIGLATVGHFCDVIEQVSSASGLPVLADADTGFGEAEMTAKVVYDYHRAGAAGFHIEDQVFPKRCGHLDGKRLVPVDHFQEKVAAARAAADALGSAGEPGFIVCARTDARGAEGLDAAIVRAKAYVDSGAEMLFPEGLTGESEFAVFAQALGSYGPGGGPFLLANMTEFGKTPLTPLSRFAALGYHSVLFPVSTLRTAMGAVAPMLSQLHTEGSVQHSLEQMQTRTSLYALLGYTPGEPWTYPSPPTVQH